MVPIYLELFSAALFQRSLAEFSSALIAIGCSMAVGVRPLSGRWRALFVPLHRQDRQARMQARPDAAHKRGPSGDPARPRQGERPVEQVDPKLARASSQRDAREVVMLSTKFC